MVNYSGDCDKLTVVIVAQLPQLSCNCAQLQLWKLYLLFTQAPAAGPERRGTVRHEREERRLPKTHEILRKNFISRQIYQVRYVFGRISARSVDWY